MLLRVQDLTGIEPTRFWGGTFHSIGHRVLRIYGDAIGLPRNFTILDADESENLLKHSVEEVDKLFFKDKINPARALYSTSFRSPAIPAHDRRNDPKKFPSTQRSFSPDSRFCQTLCRKKREQNVVDYDDLLEMWLELLQKAPDIAAYFNSVFVTFSSMSIRIRIHSSQGDRSNGRAPPRDGGRR